MTDRSVAPLARTSTHQLDRVVDRIELELHRLRERRPGLGARLDRAANILLTHLACPRQRVIRVRLRVNGQATFLVAGSKGAIYTVDTTSWQCSCPDAHRRGKGCKHSLACWMLWRASQPAVRKCTCAGCSKLAPRGELVEVTHEHQSEQWFPGDLLCKPCADRSGVEW